MARAARQLRHRGPPGDRGQPVLVAALATGPGPGIIETRLNDYTYRVIGKKWVAPTDTAVLDPVPSHPRQRPTRRLITLITCDPAWTGTHRVIVTGVLVAAKPR